MTNSAIDRIWWPLRLTYGVVALAAGLDKFLNLLLAGFLDTAVRDIAMSVGAWTLARITELREPASEPLEGTVHPAGAGA